MKPLVINLPSDQAQAFTNLINTMNYDDLRFFASSSDEATAMHYAFINLKHLFKQQGLEKKGNN